MSNHAVENTSRLAAAQAAAERVVDPEIPVLTIADMGILRNVSLEGETVVVTITPTYSGCPAMNMIAMEIQTEMLKAGFPDVVVREVLSPAWTTDWITEEAREKMRGTGIAPPAEASNSKRALFGETLVTCPKCGAEDTERISEFGTTACKALYRCRACREPFDYFKCI